MLLNSIFLIGAVQAIFLAFVFICRDKKSLADKLLICWLVLISFHLLSTYFGFSGVYKNFPELIAYGSSLMLLEGPFLYVYALFAVGKEKKLKVDMLVHSIPFLFFTGYFIYKSSQFDHEHLYNAMTDLVDDTSNVMLIVFGLFNHLHLIIYLILSFMLLRRYTNTLPEIYSFTEDINLKWLKNLILGLTTIAVIILIGLIMSDIFTFIGHKTKASIIFVALAALPFYMSFYAIRQKIIYPEEAVNDTKLKYASSGLSEEESKVKAKCLESFMIAEKPFLNPKLSIKDLADQLEEHPKQLSQIINENYDQNFFNFINYFRVEEFKKQLIDPKNKDFTLIAIAYDCGFNTKSSFNSIFKKFTGKTPSQYKSAIN